MRNSKVVFILFIGLVAFAVGTLFSVMYFPDHQPLFGFMSGIAGNFSGALFTYLQVSKNDDSK